MSEKIGWGILSTGNIARQFARGLRSVPDAELVAVGSRTIESANRFGDMFNVPHRHASYEALANDPDVDVIYIGTPHSLHYENSILCLEAGKAVLCEKPFAINAIEAEAVIKTAQQQNLFLMEAMWTRFIPSVVKLRQLLTDGAIGEVRLFVGDFGFRAEFKPAGRLFNPSLGGGALLDAGVYPLSMASMILGAPAKIISLAHLGETGVDEQEAIILGYDEGRLAIIYSAIRADTPGEAIVIGVKGQIRVHNPIFRPTRLTLSKVGQDDEVMDIPYEGNGYNYQAAEVMRCIRAGKIESETMPHAETLAIMRTMDQIRAQWGLEYPME
jgi:predicted dehydrogenase